MRRETHLSEEDKQLFREAVSDVSPLSNDRAELKMPRPAPRPQQRLLDDRQVLQDMLSDTIEPWEMETGEELLYAREGLQHSVLRKLRRGQYSLGAELDLHGLTVVQARSALAEFLRDSQVRGFRCVRIIHGKGNRSLRQQPVLKGKVNHWLRQRDEVLAFVSARPIDGGTGAIYVLLKRG